MTKHKVKLIIDEGTEVERVREGYISNDATDKIDTDLKLLINYEEDLLEFYRKYK